MCPSSKQTTFLFTLSVLTLVLVPSGVFCQSPEVATFLPPLDRPVHLRVRQEIQPGRTIKTGPGGYVALVYHWTPRGTDKKCEGFWQLGSNSSGIVPDLSGQQCADRNKESFQGPLASGVRTVFYPAASPAGNSNSDVKKADIPGEGARWVPSTWKDINAAVDQLPQALRAKVISVNGNDLELEVVFKDEPKLKESEESNYPPVRMSFRDEGSALRGIDVDKLLGRQVYVEYIKDSPHRLLYLQLVGSDEFYRKFGFEQRKSGNCTDAQSGETCVTFDKDKYIWLVNDNIQSKNRYHSPFGFTVLIARGSKGEYQHVYGTEYVKFVPDQ